MKASLFSPAKHNSCQSTLKILASSPDSGILQSSLHAPSSFQPQSPIITSQTTTPSACSRNSNNHPKNFQPTRTGTTPRSRSAGTLRSNRKAIHLNVYSSFILITSLPFPLLITKKLKQLAKSF